jgi:hypothetical protein
LVQRAAVDAKQICDKLDGAGPEAGCSQTSSRTLFAALHFGHSGNGSTC